MNDKLLHFLGGAVIAIAVSFSAFWLGLTIAASAILGVAIVALAGAAKEWVYDAARPKEHTVDRVDFLATTAGGVVGSIVFMVAKGIPMSVVWFLLGLAGGVLVGIGFACYRHRDKLKPRTVMQSIVRALGGGGGGPVEPF